MDVGQEGRYLIDDTSHGYFFQHTHRFRRPKTMRILDALHSMPYTINHQVWDGRAKLSVNEWQGMSTGSSVAAIACLLPSRAGFETLF